jgi:chitinase
VSIVILAFVNTNPDGSVTIDEVNYPTALVSNWQANGKKVIISVGGQNGNWLNVFASSSSIDNFVNSIVTILQKYNLDGVDLDIENYATPPIVVATAIIQLKAAIGTKLLIVSPEDVGVYEGTSIPDENTGGIYWNYWVPIIRRADSAIDYYQPQAYNNWFDSEAGGSFLYLKDVY